MRDVAWLLKLKPGDKVTILSRGAKVTGTVEDNGLEIMPLSNEHSVLAPDKYMGHIYVSGYVFDHNGRRTWSCDSGVRYELLTPYEAEDN